MGMSSFYGPAKPEQDMIKLIHHAIDSGITFLDTSDIYGPFLNEILLGKVFMTIFLSLCDICPVVSSYFAFLFVLYN